MTEQDEVLAVLVTGERKRGGRIMIRCPYCHRSHLHGGSGLRRAHCWQGYYWVKQP